MKTIALANSDWVAVVDDADYDWLSQHKWQLSSCGYARRGRDGAQAGMPMHREILQAAERLDVDHIDHNKLNNQRANLRLATRQENARNRPKRQSLNGYLKGAYFHRRSGRWNAYGALYQQRIFLGSFATEEEAGRAYDRFALREFGQFACLNFPSSNTAVDVSAITHSGSRKTLRKARNAQSERTHCPQGHAYSADNLYPSDTARRCKACHNARSAARLREVRAQLREAARTRTGEAIVRCTRVAVYAIRDARGYKHTAQLPLSDDMNAPATYEKNGHVMKFVITLDRDDVTDDLIASALADVEARRA